MYMCVFVHNIFMYTHTLTHTRVPLILENLENNKFIFQVPEISLNFTNSVWNVQENILLVKKINLEQKSLWINIMPVEENL